ncbi:ATP-binding protein [Parabacteroides faecis]|uniref:ATP-binding protein n=1 Tax=Parabacteroides faecis TaxID=1217282 RepID=UPI0021666403|nr:ATP-binding protein [Parabacteroides faecis]MCS2891268.1 hypothetical protein [Parabacteroides faecis]
MDEWDDWTFLQRVGVACKKQLRRAALLLLGKDSCQHFVDPAVLRITWILRDIHNMEVGYEHFTIPYLLTIDKILAKIHNQNIRKLPGGSLFPAAMKQYDDYMIREALHNCIAYTDYKMGQCITLIEKENNYLCFSNGGRFLPGNIEYVLQDGPFKYYRNTCLCTGMVNLNMIDTIGGGIKKMFMEQRKRYFPMPDYIIDNIKGEVTVKIYGCILDPKYVDLLKDKDLNLSLSDCIWLDAVQKNKPITNDAIKCLKAKGLIGGRKPHFFILSKSTKVVDRMPGYGSLLKIDKDVCWELVRKMLLRTENRGVTLSDIFKTLTKALPETENEDQMLRWVSNYLTVLRKEHKIEYQNKRWFLVVDGTIHNFV